MNISELQQTARAAGIQNVDLMCSEIELVHAIQKAEHHAPCYLSENRFFCNEKECEWSHECNRLLAAWMR